MVLQLPVQSVPITIKVVSSNPVQGEVYSDLPQVSGFLHHKPNHKPYIPCLILWLHCISLDKSYWMTCLFHMTDYHQLGMWISIYLNLILSCGTIFTHCDIEIWEPCHRCSYYILLIIRRLSDLAVSTVVTWRYHVIFPFNLLHGFLIQHVILSSNWDMQHT